MFNKKRAAACLGLWICLAAPAAWADLYQASAAYEKQDLPKAFELYRELAELGQPEAQENLAIMYVNGEGTKRDNVLGYAWAKLALEGGDREVAKGIVAQLEPHLNDAARVRAGEVWSRFGREALLKRILPVERLVTPPRSEPSCAMLRPADPNDFYPPEAKRAMMSGTVQIEARIEPDGTSRRTRIWYALPSGYFEDSARAVAMASHYRPKMENGVGVECSILFRVKYAIHRGGDPLNTSDSKAAKTVADLGTKAMAGDPRSQLSYGIVISMRSEFDTAQEKPMRWFLAAAQAGVPAAQYLLGLHLMRGSGVEEDKAKAVFWLEEGAKNGAGAAATALASYLLRRDADAAERERGFDWMKRASESTHREGKLLFATLLVSWPDASRRDPAQALKLIDEAALDYDPVSLEVRAAALAAQGDFKGAQRAEQRAIGLGRRLDWEVAPQLARLAAYEKGQLAVGELISF